jgi:methylase of polypeptide subunit release factors
VVLVCRLALDGGRDGFDIVRNILERVSQLTSLRTWPAAGLFLELDETHCAVVQEYGQQSGLMLNMVSDLYGKPRFVTCELK